MYIYDLPTIYGRFIDIKTQLKDIVKTIKGDTKEQISSANEVVKVTLENELNEATSKIWGNSKTIPNRNKFLFKAATKDRASIL